MASSRKAVTSPKAYRAKKAKDPIELPSGAYMYIKRPGMEKFLSAGFLPDSLQATIRKEIAQASGKPDRKMTIQDVDMDDLDGYLDAMDRICEVVVVEPKVVWHKELVRDPESGDILYDTKGHEKTRVIAEEDRDDEVLYTDEMDQMDKNFIFQYAVGGSADLTRFRAATDALVDAVSAGGTVEHASEPASAAD